ncbi:ATP-dependent DNA ligase [compost metagenome]
MSVNQATDPVAELMASVGIMKPNSASKEKPKDLMKLDALLDDVNYVMEEKIDGCHYLMASHRFFSSKNVEKTNNFPHLKNFFMQLQMYNLILDGEIHFPGKTSQYATHATGGNPESSIQFQQQNGWCHYTIFDILRTPKANWLIRNTYEERRKTLKYFYDTFIVGTAMAEYIHLVPMVTDNKREYLDRLLDSGLEGGVLKRLDSHYHMGKKPMWQWMKIKQDDESDLVIMGFEPASVKYTGPNAETWPYWMEINGVSVPVTKYHYNGWIGKVVMGAYVDGILIKICTASGMSEPVRQQMTDDPDAFIGKVARITFMEKTEDGYPRHPSYKNLHETKQAAECTWEF